MANRTFQQFTLSLVPALVVLTGKVAIGASGAPTLTTGQLNGVASVTRTGTGAYTLTLQDIYTDYLFIDIKELLVTTADIAVVINSIDVTNTKQITFTTVDYATGQTPTDPLSGSVLSFLITLANSSVRL